MCKNPDQKKNGSTAFYTLLLATYHKLRVRRHKGMVFNLIDQKIFPTLQIAELHLVITRNK